MASLNSDPSERRRIQFTDSNKVRHTIRLGRIPKRAAETIKIYVEHLITAQQTKLPVDSETSKWVASLDDTLAAKISKAGLIKLRSSSMLGPFIDGYINSRSDIQPRTYSNLCNSRKQLTVFFGEDKPLRDILPGDADEWRQSLVAKGYAEATISKAVKTAKQFFKVALRKGLIQENPFIDLKTGSECNELRLRFITQETIYKVIDAAPDTEWRLLIALARFGGLRTPSALFKFSFGLFFRLPRERTLERQNMDLQLAVAKRWG